MEGDAGAGRRLNPTDANASSPSEVTPEDSSESSGGADQSTTVVTPEDSSESPSGTEQTIIQVAPGDPSGSPSGAEQAGTAVLPDSSDEETGVEESSLGGETAAADRGASRLAQRRWLVGITTVLVLLAGGVGAGGYLALRFHQQSQTLARNDAAAMKAAQECVAATQAPDTAAMNEAARKIVDCSTGDFGAQAALYSGLLAEAYQAANVHVQVSDMRAAVERNNDDGSIDVLVALRTKVTNAEAQNQEQGYRLRVKMTQADGQYKVSKLDQVAK